MQPEIDLGPITLQTFGLSFALAFIAAGWLLWKRLGELGKPVDWSYEIGFSALLGGLVGGAIGVCIWAWYRGYLGTALLDLCAPALALGYAVGRIGCQLSGDGDYGQPWDGPWAMSYPDGTVPTTDEVHPTPVYETLAMAGVAYVLWRLRDRLTGGLLFALYLVLAGTERLLVEFIRRNEDVALGLTQAQLISIGMILAGGIWLAASSRGDRGEPAAA